MEPGPTEVYPARDLEVGVRRLLVMQPVARRMHSEASHRYRVA